MRTSLPFALTLLVAVTATACTGGGALPPTGGADTPSAVPAVADGAISHPTGKDQIILRFDEAGGMMVPEWFAAHAPYFTLFGDGTVVFSSASDMPAPSADGTMVNSPYRTATLTEDQIQALLVAALRDGGLGVARAEYQNPMVADAPTAVFEINADGTTKSVSVVALGLEDMEPNADTAIKQAMAELGTRLRDFDAGGTLNSVLYEPAAYRGVLTQVDGLEGVAFRDWPWADLTPADFAPPEDPMGLQQATRELTPEQAAAVGVENFQGGISGGVYLRDADGKTYTFALRPLLPGEQE